jgi:hypothetical protein
LKILSLYKKFSIKNLVKYLFNNKVAKKMSKIAFKINLMDNFYKILNKIIRIHINKIISIQNTKNNNKL